MFNAVLILDRLARRMTDNCLVVVVLDTNDCDWPAITFSQKQGKGGTGGKGQQPQQPHTHTHTHEKVN